MQASLRVAAIRNPADADHIDMNLRCRRLDLYRLELVELRVVGVVQPIDIGLELRFQHLNLLLHGFDGLSGPGDVAGFSSDPSSHRARDRSRAAPSRIDLPPEIESAELLEILHS
ncbi:MAG TPA: hypothetical protein VMR74_03125 [Gammaproteobacteria bacterium]|nr:hypothetical protein [Gammaproteobacteria bacterium]